MKHMWVEIKYTPIEPEVADDGKTINIFATEGAIEAADEDTAHGCWCCNERLTVDNINDECIASVHEQIDGNEAVRQNRAEEQ